MRKFLTIVLLISVILSALGCGSTADPTVEGYGENVAVGRDFVNLNEDGKESEEGTEGEVLMRGGDGFAKTTAIADAFVRGGAHADSNLNETRLSSGHLEIKTMPESADTERHVLLRFDISSLTLNKMRTVYLRVDFAYTGVSDAGDGIDLLVYGVSNDWSPEKVTYNNAPAHGQNNYVGKGIVTRKGVTQVDVSDYVFEAFENGESEVSFCLTFSNGPKSPANIVSCSSSETDRRPVLLASDSAKNYSCDILMNDSDNDVIWAYAQKVYDEWYARYQQILKAGDYSYETVVTNASEYTEKVTARGGNGSSAIGTYDTRLVSTLSGYREKVYAVDSYGGALTGEKQEATGYYYTKKIGDRWWVVDPLGNLCHIHGTTHMQWAYGGTSPYQKEMAEKIYGSLEKWAIAATRWAIDEVGFNLAHAASNELRGVEGNISITSQPRGLNSYANGKGISIATTGVMPAFDPDFVIFMDESAKSAAKAWEGKSYVFGYSTDNELPVSDYMLANYLMLDPTRMENYYSYVCAWTWFKNITGLDNPSVLEIDSYSAKLGVDLWDLFKGFVYDRYYSVCDTALQKYDPRRLYLGNRYLIEADKWEWMMRFTGYWCDIMCINYYHVWEIPSSDDTYGPSLDQLGKWLGIPFIVTEFYAKGDDALNTLGDPFTNNSGAGWVVATQKERGYFFQNFTLKLLQCKHNVGWMQFQFIDNDPTDPAGGDVAANSNKGIVDSQHDFEVYSDYTEQIALMNKNSYALIEYFDGVDYIK